MAGGIFSNGVRSASTPAVSEAEERALGKARLSTERVLQELERAIFADPRKLYDEQGRSKPIHSLDEDTAAAIASLDMHEMATSNGSQHRAIGRTTKVRFVDKLVAIDRAMKHLGLFERDSLQMRSNLTIHVGLVASPKLSDSDED
jgi:phage terminase small subunit